MGAAFFSLVEALRYFGWAAIGIHFVYLYAIPAMLVMTVCHLAAFALKGAVQRALRTVAFGLSCVIGISFLVLVFINPTLKIGLILLCAAVMCIRTFLLLRGAGDSIGEP